MICCLSAALIFAQIGILWRWITQKARLIWFSISLFAGFGLLGMTIWYHPKPQSLEEVLANPLNYCQAFKGADIAR